MLVKAAAAERGFNAFLIEPINPAGSLMRCIHSPSNRPTATSSKT